MKMKIIRCVGLAIYTLFRVGTGAHTMLSASAASITTVIHSVSLQVAAMSNEHPKTKRNQSKLAVLCGKKSLHIL